MSTLRDDVLPIVADGRTLIDELGFRTYSVTRRIRTWSGTEDGGPEVGVGTATEDLLELDPRPKVKDASDGTVLVVGPITPDFGTGGYTPDDLNPTSLSAGQELDYLVVDPSGSTHRYAPTEIDTTKPLRYMLTLRLLDRDIPV